MQTENRLLDDLARMANGALNTLSGVREEIESRVRERVERMLADMDMVPREEFEAVRAMAQTARSEQEDLAARVAELERRLSSVSGAAPPATAQPAAAQPATAKSATARSATPKKPKPGVTRSRPAGPKTAAKPTSE
jgi:BMFP domain-containing protein YqiC